MLAPTIQNIGTDHSKHRHWPPKMSDHPKCRHRKLKMSGPTTQNVSTDHPKCPTTQMSAPKTQNVGTDYPKCLTTQNVGTENSKCRHRLHYTIDAVLVVMGNVDVRWLYSTVCAPYSTVLFRPIVQSYVMRPRELNNFASCHMSFEPVNMFPNELKNG